MSKKEIQAAMREAQLEAKNAETAEVREAAVKRFEDLKREFETADAQERCKASEPVDGRKAFREAVMEICAAGAKREITFNQFSVTPAGGGEAVLTASNTKVSADAEGKTVNGLLPMLEKGLIYEKVGLHMQTGVTNKLVWPYAATNVEVAERSEKAAATEKDIDFSNITASPSEHGIVIKLTNEAIDNTAFDIYGFVQSQLTLAEQRYINKKMFAPAYFTGLKGPFALASDAATSLTAIDGSWKAILAKIALVASKGYDMSGFAFVMPARTKALLEATPKANGQGGFVCENGRIAGYPVFVTEFVGLYQNNSHGQEYNSDEYPIAFGPWNLLALCQHGVCRITVDATTLAEYNEVRFILHNTYSITDLSKRGNDTAFSIYKLNDCSANGVVVEQVKGTVKTKEQQA